MNYCISFLTVLIVYPLLPLTKSFELDVLATWISQIYAPWLPIYYLAPLLSNQTNARNPCSLPARVCHYISTNHFYFLHGVHHLESFVISYHWDISFNTETWQMNKNISMLFIKFKENGKITSAL